MPYAVPVERAAHQGLREIAVRLPVGPLALSLETGRKGVVPDGLFLESHVVQAGIAQHQVADDEGHLHDKLPVAVLLLAGLLPLGAVLVPSLLRLAIFFGPGHGLDKLVVVVDAFIHATQDFGLVHALVAHAQVFLEELLVHDAAGDAHALAAD